MRRADMDSALRRVRDVRLALAGLLVLSMTANVALTVSFAGRETVTVLLPATAGPAWEVGGSGVGIDRAGARYLEDMARTVAVTLLTLTPENASRVRLAAARMSHASARGAIGAWVEAEAARMAGRDLASAFYPVEIEADPARLTVEIAGELVTWIGREESSREDRRYRLAFRIDARAHRVAALRTTGGRKMTRRTGIAALLAAHLFFMAAVVAAPPAAAMQILDAADHAELAAEISATNVNRIALARDRIARVVRSPDGYAVEHDGASGDLYLRPSAPGAPGAAPGGPVTLFVGTEKGFTYRLTLTPSVRGSAQILIRNRGGRGGGPRRYPRGQRARGGAGRPGARRCPPGGAARLRDPRIGRRSGCRADVHRDLAGSALRGSGVRGRASGIGRCGRRCGPRRDHRRPRGCRPCVGALAGGVRHRGLRAAVSASR